MTTHFLEKNRQTAFELALDKICSVTSHNRTQLEPSFFLTNLRLLTSTSTSSVHVTQIVFSYSSLVKILSSALIRCFRVLPVKTPSSSSESEYQNH